MTQAAPHTPNPAAPAFIKLMRSLKALTPLQVELLKFIIDKGWASPHHRPAKVTEKAFARVAGALESNGLVTQYPLSGHWVLSPESSDHLAQMRRSLP